MSLTTEALEMLDDIRGYFGDSNDLAILIHSTDDDVDYETVLTIESGWALQATKEGPILQLVETDVVTPEILEQANAFAIEEQVYKISGTDKKRPFGEPLMWTFNVTTTGETFAS